MSRLYMKQQVFSLVDKFTVKNEYEQAYQEEGPVIYCEKAWKTKAPDPEVAMF